ncbi:hypothetical protein WJX72_002038 [[Myrmecia] bisecta]|uniref:CBM20 domain-containing protein n=1 Tax=[Myrmecia] bisecta TaxID=41462 RepID=A0AAW1P1M1_9CHLO
MEHLLHRHPVQWLGSLRSGSHRLRNSAAYQKLRKQTGWRDRPSGNERGANSDTPDELQQQQQQQSPNQGYRQPSLAKPELVSSRFAPAVSRPAPSQAPSAGHASAPKRLTTVRFWLTFHAEYGQRLRVVGSHEHLGAWQLIDGPELHWSDGDRWHVDVQLPAGSVYEYKYVLLEGNGTHAIAWQRGNNSVLALKHDEAEVEVYDNWGGQPGAAVVAGGHASTRENRLLTWANEIEALVASQRGELRRSRMELAAAQEEARESREEARRLRAELALVETERKRSALKMQQLETSNRLLRTQLAETTVSFRHAMEKAHEFLLQAEGTVRASYEEADSHSDDKYNSGEAQSLDHEGGEPDGIYHRAACRNQGAHSMADEYCVVLVGQTGAGKSTFITMLANYFQNMWELDGDHFRRDVLAIKAEVTRTESQLEDGRAPACVEYAFSYKGKSIRFIDTPGFSDHPDPAKREEEDGYVSHRIVQAVTSDTMLRLDAILNIVDCSDSQHIRAKDYVEELEYALPYSVRDAFANLMVIYTKCDSGDDSFDPPDLALLPPLTSQHNIFYMQNSAFEAAPSAWKDPQALAKLQEDWRTSMSEIRAILDRILAMMSSCSSSVSRSSCLPARVKSLGPKALAELAWPNLRAVLPAIEKQLAPEAIKLLAYIAKLAPRRAAPAVMDKLTSLTAAAAVAASHADIGNLYSSDAFDVLANHGWVDGCYAQPVEVGALQEQLTAKLRTSLAALAGPATPGSGASGDGRSVRATPDSQAGAATVSGAAKRVDPTSGPAATGAAAAATPPRVTARLQEQPPVRSSTKRIVVPPADATSPAPTVAIRLAAMA